MGVTKGGRNHNKKKNHNRIGHSGLHVISDSPENRREVVVLTSIGEGKFHSITRHEMKDVNGTWSPIPGNLAQTRSKVKATKDKHVPYKKHVVEEIND